MNGDRTGTTDHLRVSDGVAPQKAGGVRAALVVAAIAVLGLGLVVGVRVKQAMAKREQVADARVEAQAAMQKREPLRLVSPTPTQWRPRVELTGTLRPWRDADVGFELGGRLVRIAVSVGDKVQEGTPLAVLDGSRAGSQVSQAEAQTRAAEANLAIALDNQKRTDALVQSKSIPEAQAEQAHQQVALARAQLEGAQASTKLAREGAGLHTITAPFRGIVTRAPTGVGGVVSPGVPLFHIEDTSHFRLSATVSEEDAPLVAVGAPVTVSYRDRAVTGKVIAVIPSLDQATRRAPIEVEIPNAATDPLLAWSFVRAHVDGGREVSALRLPVTARRPGAQDEVVTVAGGRAKIVRVVHAVDDDGAWIVRGGLAPTDQVIVSPDGELKDNDPVEAAPAPRAP